MLLQQYCSDKLFQIKVAIIIQPFGFPPWGHITHFILKMQEVPLCMFLALHSGGSLLSICAHGENNVYGVSCTDKTVEVTQFSSDQYFPLTLTILMLCIAKKWDLHSTPMLSLCHTDNRHMHKHVYIHTHTVSSIVFELIWTEGCSLRRRERERQASERCYF